MKIYEMAVKRPVTTIMIILSLVFFGIVSYTRTPVDLLPAMNIPVAMVMTQYNAGPEEVESIVTTNLETAISRVPKVKTMQSSTSEGMSLIIVQFQDDVDMDSVTYKLDQNVSMVKTMLPEGVSDPIILAMDPTQIPVLGASISHDSMSQAELYRYVESNILPGLESTSGVSSVSMAGGVTSQVEITVQQDKMMQYGFAINSLVQQLQADNVSMPGGMTSKGDINMNLKVDGKYSSLEEIENLVLTSQATGASIRLKDVATVKMVDDNGGSIFRSNGKPSLSLTFNKESTANIIETAKAVKEQLKEIEDKNPGMHSSVTQDQSVFIDDSVKNVMNSAIVGVILAVLVLLFFLKDLKTSLIVGIAMPVSIISTFTFLYALNITINILSLGGLTFAVGMLVDNSIIVLENIFRYIELGESRVDAAIKGTKEVMMAIFASTITNIAIFLPIVFTGGMIGDWLSNLALTITVSLLCSMLVAVTVIPMFAAMFIKNTDKIKILDKGKGNVYYEKSLNRSLKYRKSTLTFAVVFSLISVIFAFTSGVILMPEMNSNSFSVTVDVENGTKLEIFDGYITAAEAKLAQLDYVEEYYSSIGSDSMGLGGGSSATISVNTKDLKDIDKSVDEITKELKETVRTAMPATEVSVMNNGGQMMGGMGGTADVSFSLSGTDLETLKGLSDTIIDKLEQEDYVEEASHSYEDGQPYISVEIDKDKASKYGLTTAAIASTITTFQKGTTATRYALGGTEIDVVVKADTDSTESVDNMKQLKIASPTGQVVPLSYIATLTEKTTPATIAKTDKIKTVTFSVSVNSSTTAGRAQGKISQVVNSINLPAGYRMDFAGNTKELTDALGQMLVAILIGVVLIYMILAAQFESFKQPLIIMVTIPFSFTGGFLILGLLRMPISIPVLMGMLMLIGIIVNNAILIVDTINQFRRDMDTDIVSVIKYTCKVRLRPILLTTLTTIFGLVPMAIGIGEGTSMMQPLAIFVAGGLLFGTILTLVVVPVLYLMTDKERPGRKKSKKELAASK